MSDFQTARQTCAIVQPHYLPWIGYFEMADRVDVFVLLDDVQFIKREWKNRNRIRKTASAEDTKWLSVPIRRECQHGLIRDAAISDDFEWIDTHGHALHEVYGRTPFYEEYAGWLNELLERHRTGSTLAALNMELIGELCRKLGITTKLVASSSLEVGGVREEKLLRICQAVEADFYLANNATATYVGAEYFGAAGIGFATQDYAHPVYGQTTRNQPLPFISHLSVIDLLFNQGSEALDIIRQGRPAP